MLEYHQSRHILTGAATWSQGPAPMDIAGLKGKTGFGKSGFGVLATSKRKAKEKVKARKARERIPM